MITEADTCRKYVLPKLYASGWNDDQISEQKRVANGLNSPMAKSETLKRLQAETAAELDAMLPSILDRALKGDLR